jgi:hypothetical protein
MEDVCAEPAWVIFPKYEAEAKPRLENKSKADAFMHAIRNSFNYSLLGETGFETATKLIDACDCYEFTYSNLDDAIEVFNSL